MASLFVVRHAHAGARSSWDSADILRPLDDKGWRQAEGLVELLGDADLKRLVSSPAIRCTQTLEPLAARLGLEVEVDDRLAEGQGVGGALALARELSPLPAALCSHGDVVPDLLDALAAMGLQLPLRRTWPKASTWVLHGDGDRLTEAEYLPPPTV